MVHYVCPGECEGESDKPGVCQAKDCSHKGKPLAACNCEDGNHDPVFSKSDDRDSGAHERPDK